MSTYRVKTRIGIGAVLLRSMGSLTHGFTWSSDPVRVIAPSRTPEFTTDGFLIPESVESYTTERSHPQWNGYCSMMARLNLYRLVGNPWSSVLRGDAIVLINRLLADDQERIVTTREEILESLE